MRGFGFLNQRSATWLVPVVLFFGAFLLVALTISDYGLTVDEPSYFQASDLEIQWLADLGKNLLTGQVAKSLEDDAIKAAWHSNPYYVPHPPFSRLLSGLTKAALVPFMDKFTAYRVAPALFFALLVTVMYLWMTAVFDRVTGLFSALALVLIPNLFGFAHFAVTDMPLTAMWVLTVYCFWKGLKDWRWSVALGIVWGLTLSTKFPALLIPIPLLLWAHLYHRRAYTNNVFALSFLSPLVMIASQPYLWRQTFLRIVQFLYEGVSRGYRPETNFAIFFRNRLLSSSDLPWFYPSFMTAVTIPETILVLILIGLVALVWVKPQREVMMLFVFNAMFILVMGLFPGAVLHDVNRLMLPVLPFLIGLASCGFFVLVRYLAERGQGISVLQRIHYLREKLIGAVFLLVLIPPVLDLLAYHPYELSYYNRLVGGIRGAYKHGLEVTYFTEAFTPQFLSFLNRQLPPNASINASFSNPIFEYYQKENRLRRDLRITDTKDFDFYILLARQSAFSKFDRSLFKTHPRPFYVYGLESVPLVSIYKAKNRQ